MRLLRCIFPGEIISAPEINAGRPEERKKASEFYGSCYRNLCDQSREDRRRQSPPETNINKSTADTRPERPASHPRAGQAECTRNRKPKSEPRDKGNSLRRETRCADLCDASKENEDGSFTSRCVDRGEDRDTTRSDVSLPRSGSQLWSAHRSPIDI